jgi:hypothetical protein
LPVASTRGNDGRVIAVSCHGRRDRDLPYKTPNIAGNRFAADIA